MRLATDAPAVASEAVPGSRQKTVCEECGFLLEYAPEDVEEGPLGCSYVHCPMCGALDMLLCDRNHRSLTPGNLKFPEYFFHISEEDGAAAVCTEDAVRTAVRDAVGELRSSGADTYSAWKSGDLFISVTRDAYDREYGITVSRDFYVTSIPFGNED